MSELAIMSNSTIEGWFHIEIRRNGKLVRELPKFRNLITDAGLKRWVNGTDFYGPKIQFGTSNTPPTVHDTGLGAPIGTPISINSVGITHNKTNPPFYSDSTVKAVFPENTIVGNLSEIALLMGGVGSGDKHYPAAPFSHSLLKDISGNPTVITVVPMEEVTVYYTVRQYEDLTDTIGTFTLGSELYSYTSVVCTHPEYIGRRSYFYHGLRDYDGNSSSAVIESEVPADPQKSGYNDKKPYASRPVMFQSTPFDETGSTHKITFDYSNNIAGDLPIASLCLYSYSGNPRRFVFTPPIPKDPTRKITFIYKNTGDRHP